MVKELLFVAVGLLVILSALGVVFLKNPVYSALSLLANLCITAVLYLAFLSAPFLAVVQLIVYVGAVVVFVLFVIMLMDIRRGEITEKLLSTRTVFGLAITVVFLGQILVLGTFMVGKLEPIKFIHAGEIADILFTKYVLPFELVSVLIFAAACGAVALAKKRL